MNKQRVSAPTPEEVLRRYWGYESFRPMQREVIEQILAGRDVLALLPTGGGKSLIYQVPALVEEGVCIVVTPLIALMKDQVDRLRRQGISALSIHSGLSKRQIEVALDNCTYGDVKLLYVAPERLASSSFQLRLRMMKVSMVAVDEAHCISQWGYDFRPSYLRIAQIREVLEGVPIMALTASATELVCKDIMKNLGFKTPNVYRGDFSRPNLSYVVRFTEDKMGMMRNVLRSVDGSAIVYMRSRGGCENVAKMLSMAGQSAMYYHAGLPHAERSTIQDEWQRGIYRVIVATNAFGMGIDKPDVRVVIHYEPCDSLEGYYQEAGRAGRDGVRSYAVLLIAPDDLWSVRQSIEKEFPSLDLVKQTYDQICSTIGVVYGEGSLRSHKFDVRAFCRANKIYSKTFESVVKLLEMNGYITLIDEFKQPSRVMFLVGRDDLYRVRITRQELDGIILALVRLYDGLFSDFRPIYEPDIAEVSGYTLERVKELLKDLVRLRLIQYIPTNRSSMIYLHKDRLKKRELYISPVTYKYRKQLYQERLGNMIKYFDNRSVCRSRMLSSYFGVDESKECGVCDICLERRRAKQGYKYKDVITLRERILVTVGDRSQPPIHLKDLVAEIRTPKQIFFEEFNRLTREGLLEMDGGCLIRRAEGFELRLGEDEGREEQKEKKKRFFGLF
ncbi:MAG: ATP-dependent DNA helicase RecQ [Rikenellaceae bacterium]